MPISTGERRTNGARSTVSVGRALSRDASSPRIVHRCHWAVSSGGGVVERVVRVLRGVENKVVAGNRVAADGPGSEVVDSAIAVQPDELDIDGARGGSGDPAENYSFTLVTTKRSGDLDPVDVHHDLSLRDGILEFHAAK